MVRKLRFHEKKLLRKVNFIQWEPNNLNELRMMRKYGVDRNEYTKYNKLAAEIRQLAEKLSTLETDDEFRNECSAQLIEKLYSIGLIHTKRLKRCKDICVSTFCRRRLPVYMIKSGMFTGPLEVAVKYVKHGHVRIGPNVIQDPAFLVTRNHQDFITWTDKFRDNIDTYNDKHDDYKD
ncbi:U3 small nucleolar ribonucleoprotein IMP3 [Dermatophagoides pteronyssinus]|uniref:U3 small nucleolar ribonucleoprotein protein IMP3-like n=2 Tax=Dermatophagoides pteronyssinus TaxID=6956 RepID=A0A6P6Y2P2_DERPT|nr:U3 small nucleolar ribonucleoprotein protein IMP3-like [Dermatophagoides pteronyssinus]KAH9415429.1 Small subunit (SSU) processome component [Dermatophagoides pteronyssinus]